METKRPKLTARQAAVLEAIATSIRDHGYPPTVREIAAAIGVKGTNGVSDHLAMLERKGYIRRDSIVSRGIAIVQHRDDAHERALLAEVARVAPIAAIRQVLNALANAEVAA